MAIASALTGGTILDWRTGVKPESRADDPERQKHFNRKTGYAP